MASTTDSVAAEVRAELARHRRRARDVAAALDCSLSTASRKINGRTPFTVADLAAIANLVGVHPSRFYSPDEPSSAAPSPSAYTDVA